MYDRCKMSLLFHIAVLQMGVLRFHVNLDIDSSFASPLWAVEAVCQVVAAILMQQIIRAVYYMHQNNAMTTGCLNSEALKLNWSCSNIRWLWILLYAEFSSTCFLSPIIEFTFAWVVLNQCFSAEWFKFVPELVAVSRDLAAAETHGCPRVFFFCLVRFLSPLECRRTVKTSSARHESHDMGAKWSIWSWCFQYLHQHLGLSDLDDLEFGCGKRRLTWQLWFLKRGITVTATVCNYLQLFATFCNYLLPISWFAF